MLYDVPGVAARLAVNSVSKGTWAYVITKLEEAQDALDKAAEVAKALGNDKELLRDIRVNAQNLADLRERHGWYGQDGTAGSD